MNGTLDAGFFGPEQKKVWNEGGKDATGADIPTVQGDTPVQWQHDEVLPLPSASEMRGIEAERDASSPGTKPEMMGPVTRAWYGRVREWLRAMQSKYQHDRHHVTGSWKMNMQEWKRRLKKLPRRRRHRVLQLLAQGVELPFDRRPPGPLRKLVNHPQLGERSDVVWATVREMLAEGSVQPHDCQGRSDEDVLPQGMFAIRWVRKGDTDKVRITINMRPLNAFLLAECSEVQLATLSRITSLWQRGDEQCSLDMHSSYYHLELNEEASDWSGFSIADDELPAGAVDVLRAKYGCCRWRDRWVFRYRGMAMGCSPSAAWYCECADALVETWKGCTVGRAVGLPPLGVRATSYIDDSLFLVQGFARGVEMCLRVALEHIICGFWVNWDKTVLLPARQLRYLGCWADSDRLRFSLPKQRCMKLRRAVQAVRAQVAKNGRVNMRQLARLVGSLWSVHVVARRAVAIMCRSMIAVLAEQLRQPWLLHVRDRFRLKVLLKRTWSVDAIWSVAAEKELRFWELVRFEDLWAPMRQWDLLPDARDCLVRPRCGRLNPRVEVFASDSSDTATGGAQFVVTDGRLMARPDRMMVVPLTEVGLEESSTYREMEGLCKLEFSLVHPACRRLFFLVDSIASMLGLLRGSRLEKLNAFAKILFLRCLRHQKLMFPLWFRRCVGMIETVDAWSHLTLSADFSLPAPLFWRANSVARRLWGKGFQFDRFASAACVMPADCRVKLPFNSEYWQPGSSGCDALRQDWRRTINWVNPPFFLLDQVLGLLKMQRAVAAVLVPRQAGGRWDVEARPGCAGYRTEFHFNPRLPQNRMRGQPRNSYSGVYAVVFVDFRESSVDEWCPLLSAEELRGMSDTAELGEGAVVLSRLEGSLAAKLSPAVELMTLPCELR